MRATAPKKHLQPFSSSHLQGLKDEDLRRAASVPTYCPSRPSQLTQENITKHGEQVDENCCIFLIYLQTGRKKIIQCYKLTDTTNYSNALRVVFGNRSPTRPPLMSSDATERMGMAQLTSRAKPKTMLPRMAPSRAGTRVTAIAVDLKQEQRQCG